MASVSALAAGRRAAAGAVGGTGNALVSRSPWDADDVVFTGNADDPAAVGAAAADMAAAFPAWASGPGRVPGLMRLRAALAGRRAEIVRLLEREAGKTSAEAAREADQLPEAIDAALRYGLARAPAAAPAPGGALVCWRPRGVAAIIAPFNYPLRLLHGLVASALAVGCTVVAKPSEHTPALGALYAAAVEDAGLAGVCRVVLGGPAVAAALIAQPEIATVVAVGGRAMGLALARALAGRPETVLALELGGVGQALVLEDAAEGEAAEAVAEGAWRAAGQRCTATRVVHVPRARAERWAGLLAQRRRAWLPGRDPSAAVGPMIDLAERERFQHPYRAPPPGLRLVAGSPLCGDDRAATADPLLLLATHPAVRANPLYHEERFGPALIVDGYADLDECVARMAANPYRLAASVFTRDADRFRALAARLPYGLVLHDRPTGGAGPDLPFGGMGLSGNGRPVAAAACQVFADECVVVPR